MKTFFKITAIALIAVLGVISCAPEVEITGRDMGEVYAFRNPAQIGGTSPARPTIAGTNGTVVVGTTDESLKELTITFPAEADVLRASNSEIQAALEKFLSFHTYSDSAIANSASTISTETIPYTFVRRDAALNQTDVVIRLEQIPAVLSFVAKFNENYTYSGGYKVNLDNDRAIEPIYGDFYVPIATTGGSPLPTLPAKDFVSPGHKNWSITVGNMPTTIPTNENTIQAITGVGGTDGTAWFNNYLTDAEVIAERKAILEGWKSKFELQKWDGNAWSKAEGAVFNYLDATTTPVAPLATGAGLYAVFTPTNLTAFRIVMNGAKNLTTEKEYYGQKQKIAVIGDGLPASYSRETVTGSPAFYFNYSDSIPPTSSPINYELSRITSDSNGKNVVVDLVFNKIPYAAPGSESVDYWPKEITLEEFKKNVRFISCPDSLSSISDVRECKKITFIGINKVTYGVSPYTTTGDTPYNPNKKTDNIKIELDPNYTLDTGTYNCALVAPGFKYESDKIIFGDYTGNWDFEIDGVKYWGFYDLYGNLVNF